MLQWETFLTLFEEEQAETIGLHLGNDSLMISENSRRV